MRNKIATLLLATTLALPLMAADLKDEFLAMEKSSWTAWGKHDVKAFGNLVTEDAVSVFSDGTSALGREKILADVGSHTCRLKSFNFSDASVRQPSEDTAILTYTAAQDLTCGEVRSPPKILVSTVYVRQDGKWRWLNYQETAIR